MWRCNRESCGCTNCTINTLQDQVRVQHGEIEQARSMNAQLQRQIQSQEVRQNEELALVLWAVNRNTGHIRSIFHQLENLPQHPHRQQAPTTFEESQASNPPLERPQIEQSAT
jgi:hypothetical protein